MIRFEINNIDRTSDCEESSLRINNQLQQRADTCSFNVFQNSKPNENQQLRIFKYATIASAAGATLTLNSDFQFGVSFFHVGQRLRIRIGDTDEETAIVSTYTEGTLTLVLTASPSGVVSAGDKIGFQLFGGVISRVGDKNVQVLNNIEYKIDGIDYTKIFDKKVISDTWEDVDSRYIINDFCNTVVNYNSTLDNLDYDNNAAIQAEWIESGDGNNPTINSSSYLEGNSSGSFGWTFAGGSATWAGTPTTKDISDFTDAASGNPVAGKLMLWLKTSNFANITSFKIRIGSDSLNYAEFTFPLVNTTDWQYLSANFVNATITGTPVWTAVDYAAIIITETVTGSVLLNGLRVNNNDAFTLYNVTSTPTFDDIRSPQLKPTSFIQLLAKTWGYMWYIDYERDIHFKDDELELAPFDLTNTSNNFLDLEIEVDQSQLGNRIIVEGGEKTSTSTYSQAIPGDGAKREWILKTKFKNLVIKIDDQSNTHAAEVGTNTTNIKVTGHGLITGDYVTNQTRDEIRSIIKVDNDNFTVETVVGQTNGDTITFFTIAKTSGIEGIVDETTVAYVHNSNEKSVRATASEATLNAGDGILFTYNERVPIQIQYSDNASVAALKALGGLGDGIFDLETYRDRNIDSIGTAIAVAQAKVTEFSNPIITGSFTTDIHGLKAGQLLRITETINRNIDDTYLIQSITIQQQGGEYADNFIYKVKFGTTLFGWIEFMQKLLAIDDRVELNVDAIVSTYVSADEIVESNDVNDVATNSGDERVTISEDVTSDDVDVAVDKTSGTWQFEPSVGQPLTTRFNLSDFG